MSEPWQHFYQSQRLRLAYWTWGNPANPPLLLVHGSRDHARNWDRVAERFRDEYHVIAPDLRGHGDSEWVRGSTYAIADHIADLVAIIDLFGGRLPVVAHSLGGMISLMTAGVFPEKFEKLVEMEGMARRIIDREPVTPERIRKWVDFTRGLETKELHPYPSFEAAVERMQEANKRLTPEMAEHLARWGSYRMDKGWVWKFDLWTRSHSPIDVTDQEMEAIWANIQCPVLHLVGEQSFATRPNYAERSLDTPIKDSRTIEIKDAGHWLHHDQLDVVVGHIRDFLGDPTPVRRD